MGSILSFVASRHTARIRGRHGTHGAALRVLPGDEPARVEEFRRTSALCVDAPYEKIRQASKATAMKHKERHEHANHPETDNSGNTFLSLTKWMVSKGDGHVLEQHLGFADGYVFIFPLCFCCLKILCEDKFREYNIMHCKMS